MFKTDIGSSPLSVLNKRVKRKVKPIIKIRIMSKNDVYGNPTYRELQICYRATDHLDEAKKQIDEALRFTGSIYLQICPI